VAAENCQSPEQQAVTKHTAGHSSVKVMPSVLAASRTEIVTNAEGSSIFRNVSQMGVSVPSSERRDGPAVSVLRACRRCGAVSVAQQYSSCLLHCLDTATQTVQVLSCLQQLRSGRVSEAGVLSHKQL
jgi:hypothetical protein